MDSRYNDSVHVQESDSAIGRGSARAMRGRLRGSATAVGLSDWLFSCARPARLDTIPTLCAVGATSSIEHSSGMNDRTALVNRTPALVA
jgi:hypothetical protein